MIFEIRFTGFPLRRLRESVSLGVDQKAVDISDLDVKFNFVRRVVNYCLPLGVWFQRTCKWFLFQRNKVSFDGAWSKLTVSTGRR